MDLREQLQSTLGNAYVIERELGGGGMSRVFVAEETALGRRVVVKVLPPELTGDVNVDRFRREIQMAARLQHPHIVPVLAAGETSGAPYYTMPFVEGESVRARLAQGPLPIGETVGILRDVAKALAYANERGIVHRDIKPDNILLSGGAAVVTDFGIAKAITAARTGGPDGPGMTLTQVGTSLGTPSYMAPEQAAADAATDHRADIYAFGATAYELLTGRPPFVAKTAQRLLAAHMAEVPQPVSELRPDTPPALAELVMRCLAKEADDRPQTAADLVRALDRVSPSDQHAAMPPILLGGRRMLGRALIIYAVAFVFVAVLAKAAIVSIGLPDWVFPGSLVVMALGLPVILFTGYAHYVTHRAVTLTPTMTPGGSPTPLVHGTMATLAVKASPHLSWRRTMSGGAVAIGAFVLLVGAFMAMRTLGIGPAASLFAAGTLNARDQLVVADFHVGGPDSSLVSVVTEAVRTGLGESSVLSVLPTAAIAATLTRMQRSPSSRLDLTLAREVAQREGAKAVVTGDVLPLGPGFVITMRLVSADSGVELASFHATADAPRDLLTALDKVTRDLRGKAGESLRQVHATPALEAVTTSSLDALRKYVAAQHAAEVETDADKAIGLLREAVQLDTTFAMAYRKLAVSYGNAQYPLATRDSAFRKAYRYRDRLTTRERLLLEGSYFESGPGRDRSRALAAFDSLLAIDPHTLSALNNSAIALLQRREYVRADSFITAAVQSQPGDAISQINRAIILIDLGRFDSATAILAAATTANPATALSARANVMAAFAQGKFDDAEQIARRYLTAPSPPQQQLVAARMLTGIMTTRGRRTESERFAAETRAAEAARGANRNALNDVVAAAMRDVWFRRNSAGALKMLDSALAVEPLTSLPEDEARPDVDVAVVYALAGQPARARAVLTAFDRSVADTSLKRWEEPFRHQALGEIALAEGKPLVAVTEFRAGDQRSDGPVESCPICVHADLGRAFDQANLPDSAIAQFELYVSTPNSLRVQPEADPFYLAGIRKRLGELYEAKGDRAKAIENDAAFVELWKNADPELQPKVAEVRARLQRLRSAEGP